LHAELDELKGAVGVLAPHEPVDRLAQPEPGVIPADLSDPVGHRVRHRKLLGALEPPVQRRPEPLRDHVLRRIEPRGQQPDRPLIGRQEQPFFRLEVQEDRALGEICGRHFFLAQKLGGRRKRHQKRRHGGGGKKLGFHVCFLPCGPLP